MKSTVVALGVFLNEKVGFMRMLVVPFLFFVSLIPANAGAITLGYPTYHGSGCPPDSVGVVFVPGESAISIGFSDLTTQALPRSKDHATCKLSIPLSVPKGVRAVIVDSDFEGFLSLPKRALAEFSAIYRIYEGSKVRGSDVVYELAYGPFNSSFLVEETHKDRLKSPCGGNFSLDLDIHIGVHNASKVEAASFTIDSTNLAAYEGSMYFYVLTEKCK